MSLTLLTKEPIIHEVLGILPDIPIQLSLQDLENLRISQWNVKGNHYILFQIGYGMDMNWKLFKVNRNINEVKLISSFNITADSMSEKDYQFLELSDKDKVLKLKEL